MTVAIVLAHVLYKSLRRRGDSRIPSIRRTGDEDFLDGCVFLELGFEFLTVCYGCGEFCVSLGGGMYVFGFLAIVFGLLRGLPWLT